MKIIDTHAHYDDRWFDEDRYEVLARYLSDNVLAIIPEFDLLVFQSPSGRDFQRVLPAASEEKGA